MVFLLLNLLYHFGGALHLKKPRSKVKQINNPRPPVCLHNEYDDNTEPELKRQSTSADITAKVGGGIHVNNAEGFLLISYLLIFNLSEIWS